MLALALVGTAAPFSLAQVAIVYQAFYRVRIPVNLFGIV